MDKNVPSITRIDDDFRKNVHHDDEGTACTNLRTLTWNSKPESGYDCLVRAILAGMRLLWLLKMDIPPHLQYPRHNLAVES